MLEGVVICVAFRPHNDVYAATREGGGTSQTPCTTPALSLIKLARISGVVPDTAAARLGSVQVGDFIIGCATHSAAMITANQIKLLISGASDVDWIASTRCPP